MSPAIQRFAPVIRFDQGGSGIGEMEKSDDGEYVRLDDVVKILFFLLGTNEFMNTETETAQEEIQ